MFFALAAAVAAAAPNLLENSGFELNGLSGWQTPVARSVEAWADGAVAHSGKHSCRISAAADAPVAWYSVFRSMPVLKAGTTLTISGFVKTNEVRDGAGAYLSLAFFDAAGTRLAFGDSPGHRSGTTDWQRLSATIQVPEGAAEMRAIVLIHGHGTAWFDEVQVEEAASPTPYRVAPGDVAEQVRLDGLAAAAADWRASCPRQPGQVRVGILDERFPPGEGCPSDPSVLAQALTGAGYQVARLTAEQTGNAGILHPAEIDLLVVPTADAFPAAAHPALVSYLMHRGLLLTMGGYAFDRPLIRFAGNWTAPESLPLGQGPAVSLFPEKTSAWSLSSNGAKKPVLREAAGPHGGPGMELHTDALDLWDSTIVSIPADKLPAGWSVTRFWAKGDASTPRMEFEWQEEDGSRWSKVLPLGTEWREYIVFPGDLSLRADSHTPGRGKKGDQFCPGRGRRMLLGVSAGVATQGQPHSIWFAEPVAQVDAAGEFRKPAPRINTRWANIRDALWPEPEQIGVFDPGFRLHQVAATAAAPGQDIVADYRWDGSLTGYSAVGMLGLNGHGFGPNRARWVPLLECTDRFGRSRGHAGAVLHQFDGTFAGSSWAIFGVTGRDLFAADSEALPKVLLPVIARLLDRCYLHDTDTALACYRQGETATFRTKISNFGVQPRNVELRVLATGQVVLTRRVQVRSGETLPVELAWKPDRFPADECRFVAELWEGGQRIDREENAFVVWNPEVLAKGPVLRKDGTRFLVNGQPQFLVGCQTYWGQNGSVTARSPAAFDRDFRQMRDCGLLWTRLFLPFKTEEDKRISDAAVQLAQKHGLLLYHTPNLQHLADPAELAVQQAVSREIATRYRGVPGLAIDICNEPSFKASDPALLRRIGQPGNTEGPWDDPRVAAVWHSVAEAERAWEKAHVSAVHEADPGRMAAVGWSQGWGGGETMKDPVLASLDLDFTDRHFYGPPPKLTAELKDLDLRSLGKPFILGECGAKNHPTFKAADPWGMGDDDAGYDSRFLYLGHHALGLGAAAVSSWHWRDPMEGVFPCGIVLSTGVPRPTAFAWRAMALAFAPLKPVSASPEVVLLLPDEARLGGQRDRVVRGFHRAADLLASSRVDFTLLPDGQTERLPKATRAVVYPLPLNPAEGVLARLKAFVEGGGRVYMAGDIGFDSARKPAGPARLRDFAGVERTGGGTTPLEPVAVKLAGAEAVQMEAGRPVLTRFRLGEGEVWFGGDLIELAPELRPEHTARYRSFLEAAKVPRFEVGPDREDLHVFRVKGEDADAWVFANLGPAAVTASTGELSLELAGNGTGYLLLGHDGSLRAAESQGRVMRNGKLLLGITGHAFVVAEDQVDLTRSRSLLLLPLQQGEIRMVGGAAPETEAAAGEIRGGQWRTLAKLPVTPGQGEWSLRIPGDLSREMVRLGSGTK